MPQDIQNIRREHTSHLAGFERAETPATNAINSSSQLTGHPASVTDLQEYRLKKAHQTTAMEQAFLIPEALVETDSNYPYSDIAALPSLDTEAALILRAHFARKILLDLSKLKEECDIPLGAIYANGIIRTIRQFREKVPFDPYVEVLAALHDAMAFQNRWSEYNSAQYEGAGKVLADYANRQLDNSSVAKAIIKLEGLGFDTTPFGQDSKWSDENEEVSLKQAN